MKLELDSRLRVFAAIARQHSFSKAAHELSISQPAVSHHIADLENDLGVQLVNRGSKQVELTPAGEYLAQYVLRAEALLVQASQGLNEYKQDFGLLFPLGVWGNSQERHSTSLDVQNPANPTHTGICLLEMNCHEGELPACGEQQLLNARNADGRILWYPLPKNPQS